MSKAHQKYLLVIARGHCMDWTPFALLSPPPSEITCMRKNGSFVKAAHTHHSLNKLDRIKNRARESTRMLMERQKSRKAWWSQAFKAPETAFNWVFAQAKTWVSALLILLTNSSPAPCGFLPTSFFAPRAKSRNGTRSRFGELRSLLHEPLESRQLMAADLMAASASEGTTSYVAESFATFTDNNGNATLDAGDSVSVVTSAGTVDLIFGTNAFDSIEAAVSAAASGDKIVILPGTYDENLNTTEAGKDLTIEIGGVVPGTVTIEKSLRLDAGDTLVARVNSDSSADQLVVKEAVAILGAALDILEGAESQNAVVRIIDNQGSADVEGQFGNTASTPSLRTIVSGTNYTISTKGGTGNDIVLDSKTPVIVTAELIKDVTDSLALNTPLSVSGNMSFAGPDYDRLTFTFKSVTSPAIGSFGFTAADPETSSVKWDYRVDNSYFKSLKAGSEMSRVYSVSVRDETDLSNILLDEVRVTIVIRGINDPPVATGLNKEVYEDGKLEGIVLPFTDPDIGDSHLFEIGNAEGQPETKGVVTFDGNGKISYDPNGKFDYLLDGETATDYFAYTVTDSAGGEGALSSTAIAMVTIRGKNTPPVAQEINFTVNEDDTGTERPFVFSDVDSDEFTFEIDTTTLSTRGEVINHENGQFTYISAGHFDALHEGEVETDRFIYTVIDKEGNRASETVVVKVEGLNDQPIANDLDLVVAEDDAIAEQSFDFDFVDQGEEAEHVFTINPNGTDTTLGSVVYLGEGKFSYTPGEAFSSLLHEPAFDSFTYTVTDPQGLASRVATVTIRVDAVNSAPIAKDVSVTVAEGQISDVTQLVVDFVDVGDEHVYEIFDEDGLPVDGIINHNDGTFQFDATTGFGWLFQEDYTKELTYRVTDAAGLTSTAKILLVVTAVDSVPKASDVEIVVAENSGATEIEFMIDFVDIGDDHTVSVDTNGTIGEVVSLGGNRYSYSPAGRFNHLFNTDGEDLFTYTVTDSGSNSSTATVRVRITPIDSTPVASNMAVSIGEDSNGEIWPVNVELVDVGDSHTYEIVSVSGGVAAIDSEGNLTYSPNGEFESLPAGGSGSAEVVYRVKDAAGNPSEATVLVTIVGANDAPVASPVNVEVLDNGSYSGAIVATDIDSGDVLSYSPVTTGTIGNVTLNPDGTFTYDPAGNFDDLAPGATRTDSFGYTVTDLSGATSTSTVTVTIVGSDKSPTATNDAYSTAVNTTLSIPAVFGLLANDSGFKGAPIHITGISAGGKSAGVGQSLALGHGNIVVQADGSFTYMPSMYATGSDQFTYTVTDGTYTSTGVVTLSILGMNSPPIAIADYAITNVGQSIIVDVMYNDFDQDGDSLILNRVRGIPVGGQVSTVTTGGGNFSIETDDLGYSRVLYTPSSTFVGVDQFSYIVTDGRGGYAGAEVYVEVRGNGGGVVNPTENNAPVARDDYYTLGNNAQLALNVFANDSDADSPAQTLTIDSITIGDQTTAFVEGNSVQFPGLGTLHFASSTGNTNFNFQPEIGATGLVEFSYTINDGHGGTSTAQVSIELKSANRDLVATEDLYQSLPGEMLIVDSGEGVSVNDAGAEGEDLLVSLISQPIDENLQPSGFVSLMEDGSFVFIPVSGFEGTVSFQYRLTDGIGGWAVGTVRIVVKSDEVVVPTPVLSGTDFVIPEGSVGGAPVGEVIVTGLDEAEYNFAILNPPENFPFAIDSNGQIVVAEGVTAESLDFDVQNEYKFTVVLHYGSDQTVQHEVTVLLSEVVTEPEPTTAPRVTAVRVASSEWPSEFTNYVHHSDFDLNGVGYAIPAGADQGKSLPWIGLNRIIVEFDQDVSQGITITNQTAFALSGTVGQSVSGVSLGTIPGISSISVVGNVATLVLERALVGSKLSLSIDSDKVENSTGKKLDGNGDGVEGDDYIFTFNVLPGDVNGDGVVNADEGLSESEDDLASRGTTGLDQRPLFDGISNFVVSVDYTFESDKYSPFRDINGNLTQGMSDRAVLSDLNGSKLV